MPNRIEGFQTKETQPEKQGFSALAILALPLLILTQATKKRGSGFLLYSSEVRGKYRKEIRLFSNGKIIDVQGAEEKRRYDKEWNSQYPDSRDEGW